MGITVFQIYRDGDACQFWVEILSIRIGDWDRSLFSYFRDWRKSELQVLFFRFRN